MKTQCGTQRGARGDHSTVLGRGWVVGQKAQAAEFTEVAENNGQGVGLTDTKNIKVLEGNHKGKVRTGINNAEQRPETDSTVLQIQLDTGWRSTAEPGLACSRSAFELAGEPTGKKCPYLLLNTKIPLNPFAPKDFLII